MTKNLLKGKKMASPTGLIEEGKGVSLRIYAVMVETEEDKEELVHYVRGLCEEILLCKKKITVRIDTS